DGGIGGGIFGDGSDGHDANCRGGGGGGGGSRSTAIPGESGNGGNGNYGGGGGGSGYINATAGSGGFGGGGGGSNFFQSAGGNGGFGGGGGAGNDGPGRGGDFGGDADEQNGGGGAGLGGAIFNEGGAVDIRNSTFLENEAITGSVPPRFGQASAGAIFSRNGSLTLLNSTLASNRARTPDFIGENASGVFVLGDGSTASFTIRNTIIFDGFGIDCVVAGSASTAGSGNLVGGNTGCPGVVSSSDPQLRPAQINPPGNTPTMAIPSNSPAFNAGDGQNCLSTDQRGVQRPQFAACDIGAYEVDCIAFAMACPPNKTQSNDPGQCGAVVTYAAPTVTGNCTPVCTPASGSFFPIGTTTVNCTADIASCSFTVTVNDTQVPTITCPANITSSTDPNQCTAVVSYSTPSASDNCSGVAVVCSPPSGSTFQKGTTTVNCTATDASKNTASCSFTVTVNDLQSPTISCPANITHSTDPGLCSAVVSYPAPVVSDNCPGVGTPICIPPSGAAFPKGTTIVNCSVTDAANNHSVCAFTVTVNDTEAPTITCPANLNVRTSSVNDVCAVVNFSPLAHDNCPGVTVSCNPPSGSCLPLGTTSVTCTATDTSTNTTQCAFTVTVFNVCLQDDANPALGFLGNSSTGEYLFCVGGTTFTGIAAVVRKGNVITFQQNGPDRRVLVTDDEGVFRGTASLQAPPGTIRCTIADRDTRNSVACQ
ncbi:MAG TPA: HYR domain-containing protein, partial [Blastocatellia bacterium]|nr:HYR domain-containing protein [Blastocatellia bacterium]